MPFGKAFGLARKRCSVEHIEDFQKETVNSLVLHFHGFHFGIEIVTVLPNALAFPFFRVKRVLESARPVGKLCEGAFLARGGKQR